MKKSFSIFLVLIAIGISIVAYGQDYILQKTITNPETGMVNENLLSDKLSDVQTLYTTGGSCKEAEVIWQITDPAAIGSKVIVSGQSGYTFNSWWLNDERVSLYGDVATPIWENPVPTEWEYPIDMTQDGEFLAVGYDDTLQVFATSSQSLVWEKIIDAGIIGVKLSLDGTMVYVVENMPEGEDKCNVTAYEVGNDDAVWQTSFAGTGTTFAASGDRSVLAFCQYTSGKKLWVIDAENGEVIFDTDYKNQNPPAFSYDGTILLNGDYSGYSFLYQYQEDIETYTEKWSFKVGGGGTSAWIVGMDVSADGSTVALGTLVFTTNGYDGEIYIFNSYSPEPLWVFENAGDQISSVALSDDGSLLAAAGYGPLNHSKPDFYLFRKQSNSPIFEVNTPGSFNSVAISGDGKLCSPTGKAVHAREMGSGGLLFSINSDPGGGMLSGSINVANAKVEVEGIDDYYAYSAEDGSYTIKYIPAGTYSIKATKVGYYPVIENNVEIAEGETQTLNFTLNETGNPPTGLMASHGSDYTVFLLWDYETPGDILGYNIYRKTIAEMQFPEDPIAFVESDVLEFEDSQVLPLTTYYYAVTAVLEEDVQSPYSNIDEGWMAHGFVINEISIYQGTTPVIDGTIDEGEWDDAFMMDASDFLGTYDNQPNPVGSVWMAYKVNEEMTELYVACINENDSLLEDHDEVALYIDDNNDGVYPPSGDDSEGNYWAAYYAAGNELKYRPIYNTGGVGEVFYLENPQLEVSDETGVIVYEFMIPIGDDENWKINPNEDNQSGMFLFVLDDPSSFDGYWPCQNLQIFEPSGYGTITFDAEDETPTPPEEVSIWWDASTPPIMIVLEWNQPQINDFDYFNVYINNSGSFELLTETIGTQLFYISDNNEYTEFYVTTVDLTGNESAPSEIMIFDITIGIDEQDFNPQVTTFPNPSFGNVSFTFVTTAASNFDISVYNSNGSLVDNIYSGMLQPGKQDFRWEAGNNASGIYFLKIINEESGISKKFMLVR